MAQQRKRRHVHIPTYTGKRKPSIVTIVIMYAIPLMWPLGVLMTVLRLRNEWRWKKYLDYCNYAAIIGYEDEISLAEIASKMNKTVFQVQSDIQTMMTKGYMEKSVYIDYSRKVLVLEEKEDETYRTPNVNVNVNVNAGETARVQPEPPKEQPVQQQPVQPQPDASKMQEDKFEEILRKMRILNDDIDDEAVSRNIDRIGELTANIFNIVRAYPERSEEVRKFMDYYLPTTFSLLESYAMMEEQSYQSTNITESRKKIEAIIEKLAGAFEQQHDRMFRKDAMDVDAEISVLEKMMASDGLLIGTEKDIHAELERRRREGK